MVNIFSLHCLLAVVFHITKAHHNEASQSETETSETVSQNKYCLQVMHLRCLIRELTNTLSYELCLPAELVGEKSVSLLKIVV